MIFIKTAFYELYAYSFMIINNVRGTCLILEFFIAFNRMFRYPKEQKNEEPV